MANSIALAKIYLSILDEVFKEGAKTSILDNQSLVREAATANSVLIPKISLQGLGDYSRETGFVAGDATLEWETHTLTQDRGRKFHIDKMDDQETAGTAFGTLAGQFMRTYVTPEVDAYRFAAMAGKAKNKVEGILTKSTIAAAIDTATEAMNEEEVPSEGRILFVSPSVYTFLKQSDAFTRNILSASPQGINTNIESFNGMPVMMVPQSRFYTAITLKNGSTGQEAGGYIKDAVEGKNINFMIVQKDCVLGIKKHEAPRIFTPEQNQLADAWMFQYRLYHDIFVPDNKVAGIYLHNKA